jgi:hypothetical protein
MTVGGGNTRPAWKRRRQGRKGREGIKSFDAKDAKAKADFQRRDAEDVEGLDRTARWKQS